MFSYRHSFHAGNHADVLKHAVLIGIMEYLTTKETALMVIDTHAGAGLYRLDSEHAQTSGEASQGLNRLVAATAMPDAPALPSALQAYLNRVASFNKPGQWDTYPGSPFLLHSLLRPQDKLKLFELHPSDIKSLTAHVAQLEAGRQVAVLREDGFEGFRKFLPPPSRRALLLCDPSYEIKSDYVRVQELVAEALKRFATGTYVVWHPIIPRPEAHDLPRRLKTLATRAGKGWLHATLTVKSGKVAPGPDGQTQKAGLPASGMFVINPPHTLQAQLQEALPILSRLLAQDRNAAFGLEASR